MTWQGSVAACGSSALLTKSCGHGHLPHPPREHFEVLPTPENRLKNVAWLKNVFLGQKGSMRHSRKLCLITAAHKDRSTDRINEMLLRTEDSMSLQDGEALLNKEEEVGGQGIVEDDPQRRRRVM